MVWTTPLKLATLPLVLAGPILRKVTETSVTVWFALKQAATVTVTVSNAQGALLTGSGVTCAVGTNLHIVAVTANKIAPTNAAGTRLGFGTVYFYDVTFAVGTAAPVSLAQATTPPGKTVDPKLSYLAYPPYNRPSFSLPPNDISKLRLIQGSCRHPNGTGGPDCLAMLDDLILQVPTDANLANAAIGVRYHIAERFVARLDYSIYTAYASDNNTAEYKAWTIGLSFFF
jgi:hypothetical protein